MSNSVNLKKNAIVVWAPGPTSIYAVEKCWAMGPTYVRLS